MRRPPRSTLSPYTTPSRPCGRTAARTAAARAMGCGMRRAAGGGRGPWTEKKTAGRRTGEGVHDARVERGSAALDELHEAFRGLGAGALARCGPAWSLDPAIA